ncbi:MAG: kinase [Oscillospiraceae bacterium]|nr:kinase [bacterium]MDY5100954.1 kinase [Oscillospiraceae bacterium]
MRLSRIQDFLREKEIAYSYYEEAGCADINFIHKGLSYHIWEYPPEEPGAQSNVRETGRMEDYGPDYEEEILAIMKTW